MKLHIIIEYPDLVSDWSGPPPWTTSPNPLYYMIQKESDNNGQPMKVKMAGDLIPRKFDCRYANTEVTCDFIGKLEFVEKLDGQHITMNNGNE